MNEVNQLLNQSMENLNLGIKQGRKIEKSRIQNRVSKVDKDLPTIEYAEKVLDVLIDYFNEEE